MNLAWRQSKRGAQAARVSFGAPSRRTSHATRASFAAPEASALPKTFRAILVFVAWIGFLTAHSAFAYDVITNVMSPVVSYQYCDSVGEDTNSPVVSPIASYQYFEWLGDGVLPLLSSPLVSYWYNIGAQEPDVGLQGRVVDSSGAPLAGATVSASVMQVILRTAQTAGDGSYALPPLPPGVYACKANLTNYASSARALTLSASTSHQDFQLTPLPPAPPVTQVTRETTVPYTTGPMGSTLKIFDGSGFVAIDSAHQPDTNRMTIVMTHGWTRNFLCGVNSGISGWPTETAAALRGSGVAADKVNIIGWDWFNAAYACPSPPEENTPSQGVALGMAMQSALGVNYTKPIHFVGHSLGTMVNAAAANYLHGDRSAQQDVSPTPWRAAPTHMTLFDQAELSRIVSVNVLFDGLTVNLANPIAVLKYAAETLQGWKPSMPVNSTWADNYISLVGFYLPNTFNIALQKAEGIAALRAASESSDPAVIAAKMLEYAHSYPMDWYNLSVATPTATSLGFQQSYEYNLKAGLPTTTFPSELFQLGDAYHQVPSASDPLALEPLPPENVFQAIVPLFGNGADVIVQGAIGTVQMVHDVAVDIRNEARAAGQAISQGFNHVGNVAAQGVQSAASLFNSACLRLTFWTGSVSAPAPRSSQLRPGSQPTPKGHDGNDVTNCAPMAWLPLAFPPNASAMAFDFSVGGDPVGDVLVCGIGTNNLFTLEGKYIPTNTISSSRLIDVSTWSGTTNELFFGFMGCTSTNATLSVENIRFYSLAPPTLEISVTGGATLLSWPITTGGYALESTPSLDSPSWETATNAPMIAADRYILTNSWTDQTRFFRLRQR